MVQSQDKLTRLKKEFTDTINQYIAPNHFKGSALARFISHYLSKWNLNHLDTYDDILLEGIKRGHEYIEKTGQPINIPEAWLRRTCLNIMRDAVKETVKNEKREKLLVDSQVNQQVNPLEEVVLKEQIQKLDEALQLLSEDDQELIKLRFYEGKKYDDIQNYYRGKEGNEFISQATLRKRESRALKKLKEKFFSLYSNEPVILGKPIK